jgi:hypothetical protein
MAGVFLTSHFDITAQGHRVDGVACLAPADAQQAGWEAKSKLVYLDLAELGSDEVPQLMDKNQKPQNRQENQDCGQFFLPLTNASLCLALSNLKGTFPGPAVSSQDFV